MKILIRNIKELVQVERNPQLRVMGKAMAHIDTIKDAYLIVEDGKFVDFGPMAELKEQTADQEIDATGRMVFPSFCDSHTHLVYAGSREIEYIDKIRGLSYDEIAKRGGGILNSAKRVQEASEDQLYEDAMQRLEQMIRFGTGAVEIKSGYGMTTEAEMKMLRVIQRLKENSPLTIKSTLLGAHGIPMEYRGRQEKFVDLVIDEMIPQAAKEELADYIDVFCDAGFFTCEDTERMLEAGAKYGINPSFFNPFEDLLTNTYEPESLFDADVIPSGLLSNMIEMTDGVYMVFTPVQMKIEDKFEIGNEMIQIPDVVVVDPMFYASEMVKTINNDFNIALNISMAFVFIVLLLSFRNIILSILAFIPMMLSWFIVLGVMGIFGLQFN